MRWLRLLGLIPHRRRDNTLELWNALSSKDDCEHAGELSTFYVDLESGRYRLCLDCGRFVRVNTEQQGDETDETST